MEIKKAVITVAGRGQRTLPLQTLIDRDGVKKSVLTIIVEEALRARVEEICLVIRPGDESAFAEVAGDHAGRLHFVRQDEPRGYGHAVYCARDFTGREPFLHLVGDHLYVSRTEEGCAEHLVRVAAAEASAVSAVQPTRENLLPYYGVVGGRRVPGRKHLYQVETVVEKPTPTEAEQHLVMPGMRAGYYLAFFGMHVLTPTLMDILEAQLAAGDRVWLAPALAELAGQEQYLALEIRDWRYDVGARYGLLIAQLALALSGRDRDQVLTRLLELLALREMGASEEGG
ncbi:MAG TPA: sugar phosphate nucleotidyltransferase [Anaerolineae bacterium]|nr:sugar phosphate nucleotidyltransferase [Anaerolineae bacterium]